MTDELCISYCSAKGFTYAGTEYASQCCELPQAPRSARVADNNPQIATQSLLPEPAQPQTPQAAAWRVLAVLLSLVVGPTG